MSAKQLMAGLGLATLSVTGTTVFAEDAVVTVSSTTETSTEQIKPVTEQEVATAKTDLDKVSDAVAKQEFVVAADKEAVVQASTEVEKATTAVQSAQELAEKATPTEVAQAENNVTAAETAVSSATQLLDNAKTNQTTAEAAVTAQENVVTSAENIIKEKKQAVTAAQAEVNAAQDVLDETNAAKLIKEAETAQANLDAAKSALQTAEQELATAKQADRNRSQAITKAQSDLTTAQNNQVSAEAAADQATQTANQTAQALATAQSELTKAENDKNSANTITLTPEYINALKEYTELVKSSGDRTDVMARLAAMAESLKQANAYKPNPNDDKTTTYPINEIPTDILTQVSLFASDLINQVRTQMGAPALTVVTPSSVTFADEVTDRAIATNWDTWTQGHNNQGITDTAKTYQLKFTNTVANYYENWAGVIHWKNTVTLAELKAHAYDAILRFLFATDEWDHANSIAGIRYSGSPTVEYFAVDMTKVGNHEGIHFLGIKDTYLSAQSTNFDTTPIANPTVSTVNFQQLRDNVTAAQLADQTAQDDKASKVAALSVANAALTVAQANLVAAQSVPEQTAAAQTKRDQAASAVTVAETANTTAQTAVQNLNADVQTKRANLEAAKAVLRQKETDLQAAQTNLTTETAKLTNLKEAVATAKQAVSEATKTLAEKEAAVQAAKDYLVTLQQAPQTLSTAKTALSTAISRLNEAQAQLDRDLQILENLKKIKAAVETTYTNLNSRYQDQLEKARLAKLKSDYEVIKSKGANPVAVLDNTGKLIAYKEEARKTQPLLGTSSTNTTQSNTLPSTGETSSTSPIVFGIILSGLGLVGFRRKQD